MAEIDRRGRGLKHFRTEKASPFIIRSNGIFHARSEGDPLKLTRFRLWRFEKIAPKDFHVLGIDLLFDTVTR